MILRKMLVVLSMAAAALVAVPVAAQAAPAACGTSPGHWVGSFAGWEIYEDAPSDIAIDVDITNGPTGLVVQLLVSDRHRYQPLESRVVNGKLVFRSFSGDFVPTYVTYTATEVACGSDGRVADFSGTVYVVMEHLDATVPFELSRV